jgi:hypothetical protein
MVPTGVCFFQLCDIKNMLETKSPSPSSTYPIYLVLHNTPTVKIEGKKRKKGKKPTPTKQKMKRISMSQSDVTRLVFSSPERLRETLIRVRALSPAKTTGSALGFLAFVCSPSSSSSLLLLAAVELAPSPHPQRLRRKVTLVRPSPAFSSLSGLQI